MFSLILIVYTILLALLLPIAAPFWILKMKRRGGFGTGLTQRIGGYDANKLRKYQGADYYHAISVGETVMAAKVIRKIRDQKPDYQAVIAVTTATGHEYAKKQNLPNTLIIYAPLDFPIFFSQLFPFLTPQKIILVDSELWPNLLNYCQKKEYPLYIINGRISESSHQNYLRFQPFISRLLEAVHGVCLDGETQAARWESLGIPRKKLHLTGSLKFDFNEDSIKAPKEFSEQLTSSLGDKHPTILLSSTHEGEERALVEQLEKSNYPFRLFITPRHAERRAVIKGDLESLGYQVTLRSQFTAPKKHSKNCFLIDTTGELTQWTALADIVIVGKSWLKKTGQNPFEAIIQGKPTVCGSDMSNFEPLFSEVVEKEGAYQVQNLQELPATIENLLADLPRAKKVGQNGKMFLQAKSGATEKTTQVLL